MTGTFIFAMPGSGKTTAVAKLKEFGITALDCDFGHYRKIVTGGKHYNEISPEEAESMRFTFYQAIRSFATSDRIIFCNEPGVAAYAAKDGHKVVFVLPEDPQVLAQHVFARDPTSWFAKDYLSNAVLWYEDWIDTAMAYADSYRTVDLMYANLPYHMLDVAKLIFFEFHYDE